MDDFCKHGNLLSISSFIVYGLSQGKSDLLSHNNLMIIEYDHFYCFVTSYITLLASFLASSKYMFSNVRITCLIIYLLLSFLNHTVCYYIGVN